MGVGAEAERPVRMLFQESTHKRSDLTRVVGDVEEVGNIFIEMNTKAASFSANKCLLSACCVPDSMLGTGNSTIDKSGTVSMEFTY